MVVSGSDPVIAWLRAGELRIEDIYRQEWAGAVRLAWLLTGRRWIAEHMAQDALLATSRHTRIELRSTVGGHGKFTPFRLRSPNLVCIRSAVLQRNDAGWGVRTDLIQLHFQRRASSSPLSTGGATGVKTTSKLDPAHSWERSPVPQGMYVSVLEA